MVKLLIISAVISHVSSSFVARPPQSSFVARRPIQHDILKHQRCRMVSTDQKSPYQQNNNTIIDSLSAPQPQPSIDGNPNDFTGAGTFGDIMASDGYSPPTTNPTSSLPRSLDSGLVTGSGRTLHERFPLDSPLTPLERIAVTANGNLQRIFSSFYDAPVHVIIDGCEMRRYGEEERCEALAVWDRCVHLTVHNQRLCTAVSEVLVRVPEIIQMVTAGEVGLGQLFRYLDKLPTFELRNVGRGPDGGLWREYTLECDELTCHIREQFSKNAWDIIPLNRIDPDNHDNTF